MSRDEAIICHCSNSLKRDVKELAEARDQSVSEFVREILKQELHEQHKDEIVRETRAEERIEETVAIAKDEIRQEVEEFKETAQQVQEVSAKSGVYSIALWEILKTDTADNRRQDALSTGSRRLRDDLLGDLDLDPEAFEAGTTESNKPWADED